MLKTLSDVKAALRVSHSKLDSSYAASIEECLADMRVKGIIEPQLSDPNIRSAVKLYCLSLHGDPAHSDAFMHRYEQKRDGLALSEGYGWRNPDE